MKPLRYIILALALLYPVSTQAFSDLSESHRHYHSLNYLQDEAIIEGYSDGTVRPDNSINRAELMKILVEGLDKSTRSSDENCFPDVKEEWFAKYVCYGQRVGWIDGYPDGTFKPSQNVNKAEALKIILNAFDIDQSAPTQHFSDSANSAWYAGYLETAVDKNYIEESSGNLYPGNNRTRGEIAEMVARIKQLAYMDDPVYTDAIKTEFATFHYLHKLREANGVTSKLTLNPHLTKTARLHSEDMAENIGELSHASSDNVTQSYDRIKAEIRKNDDANFDGRTGENVGGGSKMWGGTAFSNVKYVHDNIFMPEPNEGCNHRTTILSTCLPFTEVGIGVYVKSTGEVFFTQDFISRSSDAKANYPSPQLEVPSEYSGSQYTVEEVENDYVFTTIEGCNNERVRVEDFIFLGVILDGSTCYIYEFAFHYESDTYINSFPEVTENSALTFYKSSLSGIDIYGDNGWQITSHSYPINLESGDTMTITIEKDGNTKSFKLDNSSSSWMRVEQL